MKNSNRKKKRRKSNTVRLTLMFLATFTAVVLVGTVSMAVIKWINEEPETTTLAYEHIKLSKETIPEGSTEEEEAKIVEAAVEEIEEANDRYTDIIEDEAYLEENNIYVKEGHSDDGLVTVTFAGDILFDSNYAVMSTLKTKGGAISEGISSDLISIMQESDIMMLNNEFPYSSQGTPTEGKQYTFRADPSTVSYLNDLDVDVVSIANNHAYDYGEAAFLDTLDTLDGAQIAHVGGGRNIDEASEPVYYIINNLKIGILAATQIEKGDTPDTKGATDTTPGVFRCWNNEKLLEKIAEVKQNCDFLILYVHWGTESTDVPDWAQEEQAPEYVSAGADLIIGDHPHVLQPVTMIDGVPVVYSLGNFWFNSKQINTCMIQATLDENGLKSLQFIPCLQSGCRTVLLSGQDAADEIQYMQSISPDVNFEQNGYITY